MEKRPVKRMNNEIERADRKNEIEVIDPVQRANPSISFRYSYREVSSARRQNLPKIKR